jgi:hypothetical protein
MTLDLAKVSPQLREMGRSLLDRHEAQAARRAYGIALLHRWADRWEELRDLAERRERRQRLASPREPLNTAVDLPLLPADHRVVATDGSQIEPDRHGPAEFYLVNVGWSALRYGPEPDAELASEPTLAYELEELFILDDEGRRRVPVQGSHLAARRAVMELERAVALGEAFDDGQPLVILQDGTLLLWVLEERPEDFLRDAFLRPYVAALRQCQALGRPLASYISRPRSTEVATLLRSATCDGATDACHPCASAAAPVGLPRRGRTVLPSRPICALDGLHDRFFFEWLAVGQRSAIFATTLNRSIEAYYGDQRIHFFFLNVGSEIARIEIPAWVAADEDALALVQAVVYDQCRRGQGYPAALTRAHEQAIVRGADRRMVRLLLDSMFSQQGLRAQLSQKESAKRVRAV